MCYIDLEPCQVWIPTTQRARKEHKCDTCGRKVARGQMYLRLFWIFEGSKGTERSCMPCWRANQKFSEHHEMGAVTPSSFEDMLLECIDENDEGAGQWKRMLARIRKRRPKAA